MGLFKKNKGYSPEDLDELLKDNGVPSITQMAAATSGRAQAAQKDAAAMDAEAKKNETNATAIYDQAVSAALVTFNNSMKTVTAQRNSATQLRGNAEKLQAIAKRFSK